MTLIPSCTAGPGKEKLAAPSDALDAVVSGGLLVFPDGENGLKKEDASLGIVFTTMFALGVLMINLYAGQADLDPGAGAAVEHHLAGRRIARVVQDLAHHRFDRQVLARPHQFAQLGVLGLGFVLQPLEVAEDGAFAELQAGAARRTFVVEADARAVLLDAGGAHVRRRIGAVRQNAGAGLLGGVVVTALALASRSYRRLAAAQAPVPV